MYKRFNLVDQLQDVQRIQRFLKAESIDIVHVHQSYDHFVGGLAVRLARRPKIIRSNYKNRPLPLLLLNEFTDVQIVFSKNCVSDTLPTYLLRPGMRLERYTRQDRHADLGIAPDDFVVGVVARIQRHRRFDILLQGIKLASERLPHLKVLIVGRGTHKDEVAIQPAHQLGLDKIVHFTGYLESAYIDTLATFNAMVFLVPGSDGTCRALREGMAMGLPVIGARRGMIPELIDDGITGLVIEDTPENIAEAIVRLAQDKALCAHMGQAGREKALQRYSIQEQAQKTVDIYREIAGRS